MSRVRGLLQQALPALGSLVLLALGGLTLLAPSANALVARLSDGASVGVQLHAGVNPAAVPGAQNGAVLAAARSLERPQDASQDVSYNGGGVLHTVRPYLVFWDPSGRLASSPAGLLLQRYLTDVAADSNEAGDTYGVGRQYYDKTGFADAGQTFSTATQAISDTDPYPLPAAPGCSTDAPTYSSCVTDGQIQNELQQLIADRGLPTGTGSPAAPAPVYFVITPPDVNVCNASLGCASSEFCSYHTWFADGQSEVIYAAVPFLPVASNPKACQTDDTTAPQEPNGDVADVIVDDLSHESNEAITDPIPGTGWITSSGDEAADLCETTYASLGGDPLPVAPATYGTLYDQLINGDQYYTQTLWSNGNQNCEAAPTGGAVTASFAGPASVMVGAQVGFDPSASESSDGFSSATWSFGDGQSTFRIGGPQALTHPFESPGVYTVSLTLVDNDGNAASTSREIAVRKDPNASFNFAPARPVAGSPVIFRAGASDQNAGVRIAYYRWYFGDGAVAFGPRAPHTFAKAGSYHVTVTVFDSLGLSATTAHTVKVRAAPAARDSSSRSRRRSASISRTARRPT